MAPETDEHAKPVVGVGVVVWKGNDVLLIRRSKPPRKGSWSLPGGRQKLGETTRETAVREVAEETGARIRVGRLLDVIDSITQQPDGLLHYTLVDFDADWIGGEITAMDDADDAVWADTDDLEPYDLWDETLRLIALSRSRRLG